MDRKVRRAGSARKDEANVTPAPERRRGWLGATGYEIALVPEVLDAEEREMAAERNADRMAAAITASLRTAAAEELSPLLEGPATVYTTNKIGPHLPGKTRSWMITNVKRMPGRRKVGRDWIISPADYQAWLTDQDTTACRDEPSGDDAHAIAQTTLANAGLRPTRGQ